MLESLTLLENGIKVLNEDFEYKLKKFEEVERELGERRNFCKEKAC